jgi:glycosyltransferase involved in cell wall biosynthesis
MSNPLVSVIVPVYNCAGFVREAIASVLDNDYEPLEVIVVDDGSTDDTVAALSAFGERIRVLRQVNAGPAAARNHAIRESRGEWLAFIDGDDLWLPGHPAHLLSYVAQHPDTRIIYGSWMYWRADADGTYPPLQKPALPSEPELDPDASGWLYAKLLFDSAIHIIASLVHRSVYDAVGGFDEGLRTGSDYDFWLKASRKFPVVKLRAPTAVYRHNPASVTNTVRAENNPYRLLKRAVDAYGLSDDAGHTVDAGAVSRRLAELSFAHGYRHYWRGDARVAVSSFAKALGHRPFHPKTAAYVVASVARFLGVYQPSQIRDA